MFRPTWGYHQADIKNIKEVNTSHYGREIALLTSYVAIQFSLHSVQD